jgi:hypothetical protein
MTTKWVQGQVVGFSYNTNKQLCVEILWKDDPENGTSLELMSSVNVFPTDSLTIMADTRTRTVAWW